MSELLKKAIVSLDDNKSDKTFIYTQLNERWRRRLRLVEPTSIGNMGSYEVLAIDFNDFDPIFAIFDPKNDRNVGYATFIQNPNSLEVERMAFDTAYQGFGLGAQFYGWLLKQSVCQTLMSGSEQSRGGRSTWEQLAKTPGILVYGWDKESQQAFSLDPNDLSAEELMWSADEAEEEDYEYSGAMIDKQLKLVLVAIKNTGKTAAGKKTAIESTTYSKNAIYRYLENEWKIFSEDKDPEYLGRLSSYECRSVEGKFGLLVAVYDPVNKINAGYAEFVLRKNNTAEVSQLGFSSAYQGLGLGSKLYAWLLKTDKFKSLMSGNEQSRGGRSTWEQLAKTPGIFVYGWNKKSQQAFSLDPNDLSAEEDIWSKDVEKVSEGGLAKKWERDEDIHHVSNEIVLVAIKDTKKGKIASNLTDTPAFKAWFAGSEVVNADGSPAVMYHATQADIGEFRPFTHFGTQAAANQRHSDTTGFYDAIGNSGRGHGSNIIPVYLSIKNALRLPDLATIDLQGNPLEYDDDPDAEIDEDDDERTYPRGWESEDALAMTLLEIGIFTIDEYEQYYYNNDAIKHLETKGYDGIVYKNAVEDKGNDSWIAFRPNQVKSAIGNNGGFDGNNQSITASTKDTTAFKSWFSGSKVVNADGSPMVMIHVTDKDFDTFNTEPNSSNFHPFDGIGAWFTGDQKLSHEVFDFYSEDEERSGFRSMPCYLSIRTPLVVDYRGSLENRIREVTVAADPEFDKQWPHMVMGYNPKFRKSLVKEAKKRLIDLGYDGVRIGIDGKSKGVSWIVFRPNQVKSALGNSGAFNVEDKRITAAERGAKAYAHDHCSVFALAVHRLTAKKLSADKGDYLSIEFMCVNSNPIFTDATKPQQQVELFDRLKLIDGVFPLAQDASEDGEVETSLVALVWKKSEEKEIRTEILNAAKACGVKVDIEDRVPYNYLLEAERGSLEAQVDRPPFNDAGEYVGRWAKTSSLKTAGYTAYVLTESAHAQLLQKFPPKFPDIIAHHVTYQFGVPNDTPTPPPAKVVAVGYASDESLEAVVVSLDGETKRKDGSTYHITLSLDKSKGRKAVDSNYVIKSNGWEPISPFEIQVEPQIIGDTSKTASTFPYAIKFASDLRERMKSRTADEEVKVPQFLYHATPESRVSQIMASGLEPRAENAQDGYSPRVHLTTSEDRAVKIAFQLRKARIEHGGESRNLMDNYTILKIDTSSLNVPFYEDGYFSGGVYTPSAIPASAISVAMTIDAETFKVKNWGKFWNSYFWGKTSGDKKATTEVTVVEAREIKNGDKLLGGKPFVVNRILREGDELVLLGKNMDQRRFGLDDLVKVKKVAGKELKKIEDLNHLKPSEQQLCRKTRPASDFPEYFHGTSSNFVEAIEKTGLRAGTYVSTDESYAEYEARHTVNGEEGFEGTGGEPVLIKINGSQLTGLMRPDPENITTATANYEDEEVWDAISEWVIDNPIPASALEVLTYEDKYKTGSNKITTYDFDLYHGTPVKNVESIKADGLTGMKAELHGGSYSVFLTKSRKRALEAAKWLHHDPEATSYAIAVVDPNKVPTWQQKDEGANELVDWITKAVPVEAIKRIEVCDKFGKVTKLAADITNSPEFKRWFGDSMKASLLDPKIIAFIETHTDHDISVDEYVELFNSGGVKTAAISPEDRTLYHGTHSPKEFTKLRPTGGDIFLWLGEIDTAQHLYAPVRGYWDEGRERVYEVRLKDDVKLADLTDPDDPFCKLFQEELLDFFKRNGHPNPNLDAEWCSTFSAVHSNQQWLKENLKKHGYAGVICNDYMRPLNGPLAGKTHNHTSVGLLNLNAIETQREMQKTASPLHSEAQDRTFYHGTSSTKAAEAILQHGIQPREVAMPDQTKSTEPSDLSGACKFASLFAQALFGGKVQGNKNHQFVVLPDGARLDLTEGSTGANDYTHDDKFWNNPEHQESMASCKPRVAEWVKEFKRGKTASAGLHPVSVDSLPKSTKTDIAYIVHDRVEWIQRAGFYEDDVYSNLFGLTDEPKVLLGTLPVEPLYATMNRSASDVVVNKYTEMLKNPNFEFDPIIVVDGKHAEGGHRMEAYHRAGRATIPVVDISNLVHADPEIWYQWMNGEDVTAAQAFPIKTASKYPTPEGITFKVTGEVRYGFLIKAWLEEEKIGHLFMKPYNHVHNAGDQIAFFVGDVNVLEEFRERGIGLLLYKEAIRIAKSKGAIALYQGIPQTDAAATIWSRLAQEYDVKTNPEGSKFIRLAKFKTASETMTMKPEIARDEPATDEDYTQRPVGDKNLTPEQLSKQYTQIQKKVQDGTREQPVTPKAPAKKRVKMPTYTPPEKNKAFKSWFGDSKVSVSGKPQVVYHGTTHDFDTFETRNGNEEGHYGAGIYFTSSRTDVENYAGVGPDLTSRIENQAERRVQEWENDGEHEGQSWDELLVLAKEEVTKELKGDNEGVVMPCYLSMQNPVIVSHKGGTRIQLMDEPEYDEENDEYIYSDEYPAVYEAMRSVFPDYEYADKAWAILADKGEDCTAFEFEEVLRGSGIAEYLIEDGGSGKYILEVYKELGYDGIIQTNADETFANMKMDKGTNHYIIWNPSQVKSALGNAGSFDKDNPSIVASKVASDDDYLYHGTSSKAVQTILANGGVMKAPSFWGTEQIANYYAEVVSEEDGTHPVVIEVPLSRFVTTALVPDTNSIEEPLTYTLGSNEKELYREWKSSGKTWQDCMDIYESIIYRNAMRITPDDLPESFSKTSAETNVGYHVTPTSNMNSILQEGLTPRIGERSQNLGEIEKGVYLFHSKAGLEDALCNWLGNAFDENEKLALLEVTIPPDATILDTTATYEVVVGSDIPPDNIRVVSSDLDEWTGFEDKTSVKGKKRFQSHRNVTASAAPSFTLNIPHVGEVKVKTEFTRGVVEPNGVDGYGFCSVDVQGSGVDGWVALRRFVGKLPKSYPEFTVFESTSNPEGKGIGFLTYCLAFRLLKSQGFNRVGSDKVGKVSPQAQGLWVKLSRWFPVTVDADEYGRGGFSLYVLDLSKVSDDLLTDESILKMMSEKEGRPEPTSLSGFDWDYDDDDDDDDYDDEDEDGVKVASIEPDDAVDVTSKTAIKQQKWYRNGYPEYGEARTAGDVVRYERDELGNGDASLSEERITELGLDNYPAKAITWVCKTKREAKRYGNDVEEWGFDTPEIIIPNDGDGGLLVLDRAYPKTAAKGGTFDIATHVQDVIDGLIQPGDRDYVPMERLHWNLVPSFDITKLGENLDWALKEVEAYPEKDGDSEYYDAFVAALKNGTIDPVIIAQDEQGAYHLWDGNHRIAKALAMGITHLPAYVGAYLVSKTAASIDSHAFESWFAGSKVVDKRGKPLKVYHGTKHTFEEFNTEGEGKTEGAGAFFTSDASNAKSYGNKVMNTYLKLVNPFEMWCSGKGWDRLSSRMRTSSDDVFNILDQHNDDDDFATSDDVARTARKLGYDGVIFYNMKDQGVGGEDFKSQNVFVVFNSNQIKTVEQVEELPYDNHDRERAGQNRLFKRPETDEEAERDGVKVSKLAANKSVTASVNSLPSYEEFLSTNGGIKALVDSEYGDWAYMEEMAEEENTTPEEFATRYLQDSYDQWSKFLNELTFPRKVYRMIGIPNINSLRTEDMGIYWALGEDRADVYGMTPEGSKYYVFEASVQHDDVDWVATLNARMYPNTGEWEDELTLIKGRPIHLTRYQVKGEGEWVDFKKSVTAAEKPNFPAKLYHGTSPSGIVGIMKTNTMFEGIHWGRPNEPHGIRLTRNKEIARQFAVEGLVNEEEGAVIEFDTAALSKKYKLVDYVDVNAHGDAFNEEEVVVLTENLKNVKSFITAIYLKDFTDDKWKNEYAQLVEQEERMSAKDWLKGYEAMKKNPLVKLAAITPAYALYIEIPEDARASFFDETPAHNLEFWAFKSRPRALKGERIIFTMDKKPVAESIVHHVEHPGKSKCDLTGKYEKQHKVFWSPADFKKYKMASSAMPTTSFKKLWHVGTMDITKKRPGSHEGSGLSVSTVPESWEQINSFTSGDHWELTKPGNKFLNFHRLSKAHRKQLYEWGMQLGYVTTQTVWRVHRTTDEEDESGGYFEFYSLEEALKEAEVDSLEEADNVEEVNEGYVPTSAFSQRMGEKVDQAFVLDFLASIYAEDVLHLDGVWWNDRHDVDSLSAPRGVIFNSMLPSWKKEKQVFEEKKDPRPADYDDFETYFKAMLNRGAAWTARSFFLDLWKRNKQQL